MSSTISATIGCNDKLDFSKHIGISRPTRGIKMAFFFQNIEHFEPGNINLGLSRKFQNS